MPTPNNNRKLTPTILQQDIDCFNGLGSIPTYQTNRSEATPQALQTAYHIILVWRQTEKEREALYQAAVDATREAERNFHNAVLALKEVVKGQFGADSNEARAIGLKKKSERKRQVQPKKATPKVPAAVN